MMPEAGTKEQFKKSVLAVLPPRKLIGYSIRDDRGAQWGFRFEAGEAIRLASRWMHEYQRSFGIYPEWLTPNGAGT